MIKVKLCGFTNKEAVDAAVENNVDFIGFVFYPPSKRNISPQNAGEIAQYIPHNIKKVAVIVDSSDVEIADIVRCLKPDFLQIHSAVKSRVLQIKNRFQIPIIKAFAIGHKDDLKLIDDYEDIAEYFLFDAKTLEAGGGGVVFDWDILKNLQTTKKWFLSGGININNIEDAINITKAEMIDLSSGIEERKGIKSVKLISELMNKIRPFVT